MTENSEDRSQNQNVEEELKSDRDDALGYSREQFDSKKKTTNKPVKKKPSKTKKKKK